MGSFIVCSRCKHLTVKETKNRVRNDYCNRFKRFFRGKFRMPYITLDGEITLVNCFEHKE